MNRREIVAELMERLDVSKDEAKAFLEAYVNIVTESLVKGESVVIQNFYGVKPITRRVVPLKGGAYNRSMVYFKASPRLLEAMNEGHPRPKPSQRSPRIPRQRARTGKKAIR